MGGDVFVGWRCASADIVLELAHAGQPQPKQRPRFASRGWAYTGQRTRHYERELRSLFAAAMLAQGRGPDGKSSFALACRFYRGDRVRCDADNLLKSVADAANGVVWADDSQVVRVSAEVYRACESPRVEVSIYRVPSG